MFFGLFRDSIARIAYFRVHFGIFGLWTASRITAFVRMHGIPAHSWGLTCDPLADSWPQNALARCLFDFFGDVLYSLHFSE